MQVTHQGLVYIEASEGFSSKVYWDKYGSVWTIGFGETDGINQYTKPITRVQAELRLIARFNKDYAWALAPFVGLKGFNQNRYDALASFIWNCGVGSVGVDTSVGKALRRRNWRSATAAMLKWNKAGGVFMQGLYDRRVRETELFLKPVAVARPIKLNDDERFNVENLRSQRRVASRHHGWSKIDASHNVSANKSKAWLQARANALEADKHIKDKEYQARKVLFLRDVAHNRKGLGA